MLSGFYARTVSRTSLEKILTAVVVNDTSIVALARIGGVICCVATVATGICIENKQKKIILWMVKYVW